MTDKVYNILKYCALIAIPAIGTFYTTIASLWGWPYITEVSGTILAFDTLLGAFIGISSARYQPEMDGVLHVNPNTKETYAAHRVRRRQGHDASEGSGKPGHVTRRKI